MSTRSRRMLLIYMVASAVCCSGCVGHRDRNFTDEVIGIVAEQIGQTTIDIERGTRLEDLAFTENDLKELIKRINEQTPADIKLDEVKSLSRASPHWKRLRLADLGYLVESKVLDRRERETPDQIRKGLKRGG
jgi:hypothetical protein